MTRDLVIIGCGGFGREVVGIVDAINDESGTDPVWNLLGFLDDSPSAFDLERVERLGLSVIGPIAGESLDQGDAGTSYVVGIGSGVARRGVVQRADSIGLVATTLIHPAALIGRSVEIGNGSIVAAGAQVTTNVSLGDHVHVDRAVHVGHDSKVGDYSTIHPAAVVSGACTVGADVELGTSCTLLPGISVAQGAVVGAHACVVRDVTVSSTVKGVPAR